MSKTTMRIAAVILAAGLSGALVGCTDTTDPTPMDPGIEQPTETSEPTDEPTSGSVTEEDATQAAIDEYGGTLVGVTADEFGGEDTWLVELTGTSDGDIGVHVSQSTGEVLGLDGE